MAKARFMVREGYWDERIIVILSSPDAQPLVYYTYPFVARQFVRIVTWGQKMPLIDQE